MAAGYSCSSANFESAAKIFEGLALFNILKPLMCGIWDTKRVTALK
jgi:hypothetical protein